MSRVIRVVPFTVGDFRDTLRARWAANRAAQEAERLDAMARTITTIPAPSAGGPTIVDVPDDVRKDLEELWAHLQTDDGKGQIALASFDTEDEAKLFVKQARSWAVTRKNDAGESEQVTFRKNPRQKDDTDKVLRFTILPYDPNAPRRGRPAKATETPVAEPVKASGRKR